MASSEKYEETTRKMKNLSDEELDLLISPSAWNQRMIRYKVIEEHDRVVTEASARVRANFECQLNVPYGPTDRQQLDILTSKSKVTGAPIFVFFHGGYWQASSRDCYHFLASLLVGRDGIMVSVGYDLTPQVTITEIVSQAKEALKKILKIAEDCNSSGIYLCGHSCGAQLAVMSFSDDLTSQGDSKANEMIKGFILIGGVYDLRPLLLTKENDVLRMTESEAWVNSPINEQNISAFEKVFGKAKVFLVIEEFDTPEFRRQSQYYYELLKQRSLSVKYLDLPGLDHFNVVEKLEEPDYILRKEMINFMGLQKKDS